MGDALLRCLLGNDFGSLKTCVVLCVFSGLKSGESWVYGMSQVVLLLLMTLIRRDLYSKI